MSRRIADIYEMRCDAERTYHVRLVDGALDPATSPLSTLLAEKRSALVTTPTVARLYARELTAFQAWAGESLTVLVLPCSERTKTMEPVLAICEHAVGHRLGRNAVLVALGGGVCSDLVTIAASLIRRGVTHVRVPTTLVGQIDAGIGIKGGINVAGRKSSLGCFWPPVSVIIDRAFLATLPQAEIRCGLAEIVKMALVADAALFAMVERFWPILCRTAFQEPPSVARTILRRSARRMLDALAENPYEDRTYRRIVDAGHTFSPLLESATGFRIAHGDAVSVDLALSTTLSSLLGLITENACLRVLRLLEQLGLPTSSPVLTLDVCREALEEAARHRGGAVNLVVPREIGRAAFVDHPRELGNGVIQEALGLLAERSCGHGRHVPAAAADRRADVLRT